MDHEDVKLDALLRGSTEPSKHVDFGRSEDRTVPMARFEQATDFHQLRDALDRQLADHDKEIRRLDVAIVGTDVNPGVYAMVFKMNSELALLRQALRDDRNHRARTDQFRDMTLFGIAGAMSICAIAMLAGLFMK